MAISGGTASEYYAVAIGDQTRATTTSAIAIGSWSTASGGLALALGSDVVASGYKSSAIGAGSVALSGYETAIGAFNTSYTPIDAAGWNAADRLFVIGNGTFSTPRSNALVMLKNGDLGLGTSTPATRLSVEGTSPAATGVDNLIVKFRDNFITVGEAPNYVMGVTRQNSNTEALYVGNDGNGNAIIASNNRDIRFGKDFTGAFTDAMRIASSGNVGIGVDAPSATLDVEGTMQYVDGNQASGKVLTSDASGNATWQAATAGAQGPAGPAGTAGTDGGNIVCVAASGNVTLNTANQFVVATTSVLTITLPASPTTGQTVHFFSENPANTSINPNGKVFRQAGGDWGTSTMSTFGVSNNSRGMTLIYNGSKWYPLGYN